MEGLNGYGFTHEVEQETLSKILLALDETIETFHATHPPDNNKTARKKSFEPIEQKIRHLEFLIREHVPYLWENIERIRTHYGAVFKISKNDDHSIDQHLLWADSAIRVIRRNIRARRN